MEFTATKEAVLLAAQNVLRAVPVKPMQPEQGSILLSAEENGIILAGTDSELGIKCWSTAQIITEGEVLLPGRYFVNVLRRLPPARFL